VKPPLNDVVVSRAAPEDLPRIENLMQFYNYDLSEWCPVEFAHHGLYAIRPKAAYWAQAAVVPYKLQVGGHWAGFAVVDDEVIDRSSQHNMGYFFVARRYRGLGIGLQLAATILREHPGRWEIYHLQGNQAARRFWPRAIASITGAAPHESSRVIDEMPSTLYAFSHSEP
jgi:predicted acetyltransferase